MRTNGHRSAKIAKWVLGIGLITVLTGCNMTSGYVMNESGTSYFERENYTMARHEFQRAVADDPDNPDYWHNLATAMKKQGDRAGAEQTYRRALNIDPSHQPAYHNLAELLTEQGRQAEAQDMLQSWAATQPYQTDSHVELAWFHRENGNLAAAEQSLQNALKINPNHHVALAQLGQVYQDSGQTQRAAALYQRSLYTHWNQPQVRSRLAALRGTQSATVRPTTYAAAPQPTYAGQTAALPVYSRHPVAYNGTPRHVTFMPTAPGYGAGVRTAKPVPQQVVRRPVQLGQPALSADPAHAPQVSTQLPVVQPH